MAQTGVVSWSQTAASNATADSNVAWPEGMAPSQVNDSARAEMSSVAKYRDDLAGTLLSSGSNTAYTVATNQIFSSLTVLHGQELTIRFAATNGAAPTLSIDSLTAKPIQVDSSFAVATGAIRGNSIHHVTYDNTLGAFILHNGHSLVEPGRITTHGSSAPPPGWLNCDGTPYSRATYADLFANIGTIYGSTDTNTFRVPDLIGRVPAGLDANAIRLNAAGGGFNAQALGNSGGIQANVLTTANLPAFTPSGSIGGSQSLGNVVNGASIGAGANIAGAGSSYNVGNYTVQGSNFSFAGASIGSTSPTAVGVVQPTLIVNYFIKT